MSLATDSATLPLPLSGRSTPAVRAEPWLSRRGYVLFLAAAAYLVTPFLDVPLWGVSWSTPALLLVAAEVFLRRPAPRWGAYSGWIAMAGLVWGGQFFSLLGNVFAGEITSLSPADLAWLLRYALWMAVFLLTATLVSSLPLGPRLASVLGLAVLLLASVRLMEVFVHGTVGAGNTVFVSQNKYGWGFSAFMPFAVFLAFTSTAWRRPAALLGLTAALLAVALNGSRSSWIAVSVGAALTLIWLFLTAGRNRLGKLIAGLTVLTFCAAAAAFVLPESWWRPVAQRAQTLQQLDRDKSFLTRRLMIRKAGLLFEQSPVFGVGPGRFRTTWVSLDLPPTLRHRTQDQYNRRSAHNSYAALLAETGLVGALPFAVLALILLVGGARAAWRHSRRGELWAIPVYAGFLGMSIHLWALAGLTGTAAWFVMGLAAALVQRESWVSLRERAYPTVRSPNPATRIF